MSAKPEVVGEINPDEMMKVRVSTMDAIAITLNQVELENQSLKRQREGLIAKNALLQEQVNEAQLKAAHQIALSKFAEAQMYQRVLKLETSVAALDEAQNRTGNIVQGLPTRDELDAVIAKLKQVGQDYYNHSAQCRC